MPIKHQMKCYRTFDGVRWPNLCDILGEEHKRDVSACRVAGVRIRIRHHAAGYKQAFYHPDDEAKIGPALRTAGRG